MFDEATMNASTSLDLVSAPLGEPLVNDNIAKYILMTMSFMILPFSVPAIFLNILNIHVFANTKLDSVTVCFLSLALSDLISMIAISNATVFNIIVAFGVHWSKNLPVYSYLLTYCHGLAMDITSATTTYIAIQRGLCVTLPFLTRYAFNKNRSLFICVSIFLVMLAFTLPRFTILKLISIPDPADNTSTLVVIEFFEQWAQYQSFYVIFMKTVKVSVEYVTMVICTMSISIGMKSSMKLKQKSTSFPYQAQSEGDPKGNKEEKPKKGAGSGEDAWLNTKHSKEFLVVKQSLIVVLIHVILTTPRMFGSLYVALEPRFRFGGQFNNFFYIFFTSINVTDAINAFVNFFVYAKFNSKFRNYFLRTIYRRG